MGNARGARPGTAEGHQDPGSSVEAPRDWETALSVAFLRESGSTQREAAKIAGVSARTVERWEASGWWPDAVAQAGRRWLPGVIHRARRALWQQMETDGDLAFRFLKEVDPAIREPMGRGAVSETELRALVRELAAAVKRHVTDESVLRAILGEWQDAVRRHGSRDGDATTVVATS